MSKNTNPTDHPVMNLAGVDENPLMAVLQKFQIIKEVSEDPIQNAIQAYDELRNLVTTTERQIHQTKLECAKTKIKAFVDERRISPDDAQFYVDCYMRDSEATMTALNNLPKPELAGGPPILGLGVPGMAKGPQGKYTEEGFMAKLDSITDPAERSRFFRENKDNITR